MFQQCIAAIRRRLRHLTALGAVGLVLATLLGWRPIAVAWNLSRGEHALAHGEPERALKRFLDAERLDPRDGRTQFLLARAYRRLGNSAEVYRRIERAYRCGFDARRLEREWILAQAQGGLMAQAEPHFSELFMNAGEDGPEICAAFASGYVQNYRFEPAQKVLDAWMADYPDDPEPHVMLGKIQQRWQNYPKAEAEFREALRLRPNDRTARSLLAQVLVEQQKNEEAMPLIEQLVREDPANDNLRMIRADCLIPLGRHEEARTVFEEILDREPKNCHALLGLGQLALWSADAKQALEHLNRAAANCPGRLDIRFARAQALGIDGERDASREEYEYVNRAQAALARSYELAGKLVREPGNAGSRIEIGASLIEYGDATEGAAWLQSVLEFEPDNRRVHQLLADYYTRTGDHDRAERHRAAAG